MHLNLVGFFAIVVLFTTMALSPCRSKTNLYIIKFLISKLQKIHTFVTLKVRTVKSNLKINFSFLGFFNLRFSELLSENVNVISNASEFSWFFAIVVLFTTMALSYLFEVL